MYKKKNVSIVTPGFVAVLQVFQALHRQHFYGFLSQIIFLCMVFKELESLTGARGASVPAWVMSPPKTPQRIAAIEANEAKWNAG